MHGDPAPGLGQVADWLASLKPAGSRPAGDDVWIRKTKGDPPTPIDLAIVDHGDRIHDVLRSWCDLVADDGNLHGPVDTVPVTTAAWLWTHHERIERSDFAATLLTELLELMRDAHALAPWRRTMRHCAGIPCPHCQVEALHIHGGDDVVTCHTCKAAIPRSRYEIWTRMLADQTQATA